MMYQLLLGATLMIHAQTTLSSNDTMNSTATTTNTTLSTTTAVATTTAPPCLAPCVCFRDARGLPAMRCRLKDLTGNWKIPPSVHSLFLTGLTQVPTDVFRNQDLGHLISLSLGGNNITSIPDGAFVGLPNLTHLDLSFTNLHSWLGDMNTTLPSLKTIDVTGTTWLPTANVLLHAKVNTVFGVTWSASCVNCTLINIHNYMPIPPSTPSTQGNATVSPLINNSTASPYVSDSVTVFPSEGSLPTSNTDLTSTAPPSAPPLGDLPNPGRSRTSEFMGTSGQKAAPSTRRAAFELTEEPPPALGTGNQAFKFYQGLGYFAQCSSSVPQCKPVFYPLPTKSPMLSLPSKLFYVTYALGAVAIALNFCILFIYVYSSSMRKVNSMLLIANMALCDVFMGIYCVLIGNINIFNVLMNEKGVQEGTLWAPKLCPTASVLFTVGQIVSVFTGLLLTIDKYLSIVYCMDPNRKISRRLSIVVLALCWAGTFVYGLFPSFETYPDLVYSPVMMCTFPVTERKGFVICFAVLILLYLTNLPFYGKIFIFVRNSSVRMGVRRDAILAKKIAFLIFTNFIFFVIPMAILFVYTVKSGSHYSLRVGEVESETEGHYIVNYWLPVTFLGINSCLNPFLCAFRQRQFRREVRKSVRKCLLSHSCKAISAIRSDSSLRTAPATRVEMYKLSKIESQAA